MLKRILESVISTYYLRPLIGARARRHTWDEVCVWAEMRYNKLRRQELH
jgi:hypothetical protein